jgi:GSH-dependent disulfide-bond oxidoreductase
MIDLYYWPTSNGRKITIMLHEVELPYNIIPVNFKIGEQHRPDYLRINPNSKIPAIVDRAPAGGGEPVTIFESVAILIYLAEKSGKLLPADLHGRYDVMKWAIFQAASIGPMFGQMAYFHDYAEPKMPAVLDRYENEVRRLYGVLDRRLAEAEYLAGCYSIADIAVWPWIQPARQEQHLEDYPNLGRWYEAIAARPAVKIGNAVRLDLQKVGVQTLSEAERRSLYGRRF